MKPPVTDELPIAIRAYATPTWKPAPVENGKPKRRRDSQLPASKWTLTFDCETTTDAGQALRFGTYQLREAGELRESGIFYDPDGVTESELATMTAFAELQGLALRDRDSFVDEIFYSKAYQLNARIIGFNLPFDISRLAIKHGSARTPIDADTHPMRGGFTFKLSKQKYHPHVRVKHMNARAALISFAAKMENPDARSQRRRGLRSPTRRGHFIDINTLASALFARRFSLGSLSKFLGVANPKLDFDDFGGPITDEILSYAVRDTQATWESYVALKDRYDGLKLVKSIPEKIYSEAGIGKAYLKEMGIAPWRKVQPDVPPELVAIIMASYYGGRSEVRIRRDIRQVMLCDFLSMYPTVCTLMGLWRFVIADGMTWREATAEARQLLESATLSQLQSPQAWAGLHMLVRVKPDADIFPVRADYGGEGQATIGANRLTSEAPLWFTLADCIASKLFTGKAPEVVEAIAFEPGVPQQDLQPIDIAGNSAYRVDPYSDDLFKRVIELRQETKGQLKVAPPEQRDRLDTEQHALKICANSTSYGIWVEVNVEDRPEPRSVTVYNSAEATFTLDNNKAEMPGSYFHPLLATLITGAARLMLAVAEKLATDAGLDWSFCDTDSMAFAKPDNIDGNEFASRVRAIVDWFSALNPYAFDGSILKIEDVNDGLDGAGPEPLYCLAISSKRYALFNLTPIGSPIMRKISAHGLGHLRAPYDESNAPACFPIPHPSVLRDGTARWHCDLWHRIVASVLEGNPNRVALDYHPALNQPTVSRYAATSPNLLHWFKTYNEGKSYREQVKPFGFLLALRAPFDLSDEERLDTKPKRGRPRKRLPVRPVAPFDTDHQKAIPFAFDRETGSAIPLDRLATYAEALATYHLSPEAKFLNADYFDIGPTLRRHVMVTAIEHIGKEAHNWERQLATGWDEVEQICYTVRP